MNRLLPLFLAATLSLPSLARYYGEGEDGYRPRCVSIHHSFSVLPDSLFFQWDEAEKTERQIHVRRLALPCRDWRSAGSGLTWLSSSRELKPGQRRIFGITLDADTLRGLDQVRYGASMLRTEMTGEAFLAKHPIHDYTIGINRWLTRLYGMGFSGEVYRAWLEQKPANHQFRDDYRQRFARALQNPGAARELEGRAKNVVAMISLGMAWDPATTPRGGTIDTFLRESHLNGIDTVILKNHPLADVWQNVGILSAQIDQALASGKDVILVGLCKGSPELLAAAASVTSGYLDGDRTQKHRPAGRGKILGFLNLSGLIGGTLFADAWKTIPGHEYAGSVLSHDSKKLLDVFPFNLVGAPGALHRTVDGMEQFGDVLLQLESMSAVQMSRFNRSTWEGRLPSDATYISGIGISSNPRGFGTADTAFALRFRDAARRFHLSDAANDTYIEYPRMALPDGISSSQYDIVFDASHIIWEGWLGQTYLNNPEARKAIFISLYESVLETAGR